MEWGTHHTTTAGSDDNVPVTPDKEAANGMEDFFELFFVVALFSAPYSSRATKS